MLSGHCPRGQWLLRQALWMAARRQRSVAALLLRLNCLQPRALAKWSHCLHHHFALKHLVVWLLSTLASLARAAQRTLQLLQC